MIVHGPAVWAVRGWWSLLLIIDCARLHVAEQLLGPTRYSPSPRASDAVMRAWAGMLLAGWGQRFGPGCSVCPCCQCCSGPRGRTAGREGLGGRRGTRTRASPSVRRAPRAEGRRPRASRARPSLVCMPSSSPRLSGAGRMNVMVGVGCSGLVGARTNNNCLNTRGCCTVCSRHACSTLLVVDFGGGAVTPVARLRCKWSATSTPRLLGTRARPPGRGGMATGTLAVLLPVTSKGTDLSSECRAQRQTGNAWPAYRLCAAWPPPLVWVEPEAAA